MRVQVLGPIAVSTPEGPLPLGGRQLAALLALLVVRAPREARSDWLIDAIWGGPRSPAALRVLVLRLRRVLADAGLGDLVHTSSGGYRLALTPQDVDAGHAAALVAAARDARLEGRPARAVELLRAVDALWRGEPFADVADLEALRPHAEQLVTLRLDALEQQAAALMELGEDEAAASMLRPLAHEHPLRERFTGLLMIALARAGRPAEGLRAYSDLRDRLADELGVVPCEELQRLEHELLLPGSEEATVDSILRAGLPDRVADQAARLPGPLHAIREGALVGRDQELARVTDRVVRVEGRSRVALITGEPGIGRTRLAAEVAYLAADRGLAVVYTACSASGGDGQEPAADLVRQLADLAPEVVGGALTDVEVSEPESSDLAADAALHRAQLQGQLLRGLEAVGRRGLLVIVDDASWVRASGARLLELLVKEQTSGVSWLFLAPSTEATPEGTDLLVGLQRAGALVEALGPLDRSAVEALSRQHLGDRAASADLSSTVAARSDGNPLYAVELSRYLRAGGDPTTAPPDVRSMVSRLLARQGSDARRLAQALALGGTTCPLAAAGRVAGLGALRAAEVADSLVGAGVLAEWGAGGGSFRHALIAQAVVDDLGPALAEQLRAELALALDADDAATSVLRADLLVAAHAAVPAKEVHVAVQRAIRRLLGRGWYEAAVALGTRYLEQVPRPEVAVPEEVNARLAVATALLAAGDTARGVRLLDEATATAEIIGLPDLRADAILARGPLGARRVPIAEIDRMVALAGEVDTDDRSRRIQLLCWAAHHLLVIGDAARASELLDRAGELVASEPSVTMRVLVLGMRYQLDAGAASTPARAAAAYDAIARLADANDYLPADLMARLFGLTQALRQAGLAEFRHRIDELRAGTRSVPRPDLVWWAEAAAAAEALASGDLDVAATRIDHADGLGRRLQVVHARPIAMLQQFLLQWEEGRLGDLAPLLQPSTLGHHPLSWLVAALASSETGDLQAAKEAVARSGRPKLADAGEQWSQIAMLAAVVCHRVGDAAWAAELHDELVPHRRSALSLHGLAYLGAVDGHLGRLAAATGDLACAVDLLLAGAEQERAWGAPRWASRSLVDAATVLRMRRDPGDQRRADQLERRAAGAVAPPDA